MGETMVELTAVRRRIRPEDRRFRKRRSVNGVSALVHGLLLIQAIAGCAQRPSALPEPAPPRGRELAAGETHSYPIRLEVGDFLVATVDQLGSDVVVTLSRPGGERLFENDIQWGRSGQEVVYWIADAPGLYELSIGHAPRSTRVGRYELRIQEPRPATERDRTDCKAQNLYINAKHLSQGGDPASHRGAIVLYLEARPLFRELGDHLSEASTLNNLGANFSELKRFDKAIEYYKQALTIWEELSDLGSKVDTLRNIGREYDNLGEKQQARKYLGEALDLAREITDSRREADVLSLHARVWRSLGDNETALGYLQTALDRYREIGLLRREASTLNRIGVILGQEGKLQEALEAYRYALKIFEDFNYKEGQAATLNNLGTIHIILGEFEVARDLFEKTLQLNQELGQRNREATALNNIGYLLELMGDVEGALDRYQQALSILEEVKDDRTKAYSLENVARVHSVLGEHAKSLELLDLALAIRRALKDRRGEAYALDTLGIAQHARGDTETAITTFEQALACARETGDFRAEAGVLQRLARAERAVGRLAAAREHIKQALEIAESARANVSSQELRYAFFASKRPQYEFYVDLLLDLHEQNPTAGYDATALQVSESARARGLLELLTEAQVDVRQGIDSALKERERAIMARLSHLQTELLEMRSAQEANRALIAQLVEALDEAEHDRRELEEEIRRRHPRYASLQYPQPLGLDEIRDLLDSETALLEYTLGQEASVLFVVTREGLITYPLASAEEIYARVDEMRGLLAQPGHSHRSDFEKVAHALYRLLIAPAEPVIAAKTRLLIAPDAALYSLSFEALLPRPFSAPRLRDLDYLLRRWSVSYVPSASVLASLEEPSRDGAASDTALAFLAFGDPLVEFGATGEAPANWPADRSGDSEVRHFLTDSEGWDVSRLKNSGSEVSGIGQLFPPEAVKIFLREEATEENAKSAAYLQHARLIHFATHGLISEQQPQRSGLVLTLDEDPAEDGLLQVYEIFNLRLNADLVVLSACETGLGKEVRGEGLIGLSRAFLYAGTPRVVVSLWQVADHSTPDLMVRFYGRLTQGMNKAEALRQAKLEMLEGRFAHPYYWAPFILIGKP